MVLYSHSRISTFEQCPLKYKFKYLEKIPPDYEQSIEGFLGSKVHETLEWVYSNIGKRTFELDELVKHYIESWNRDFNESIKIIKEDISPEYYFNKGIKFLINYFLKYSPFIDNTIATEKKIIFNLDSSKDYKFIGYIDRLTHDPEINIFEIHDYKTSSHMKSQEDLDNDRQLALYSLAIHELFENVKEVRLIWHFLEHNEQKTSQRTLDQLNELRRRTVELIQNIESTTHFQPNPGCLCRWCEYLSKCPSAKKDSSEECNKNWF